MLSEHRSSTLHRPEQHKSTPISEVYDEIMRNFDKEALRIRFKFSNPSFDDAMLVRPRKTLPKIQVETERKGRLKFYSNKLVVNEAVYINERKELTPEMSEETQFKKLFIPNSKQSSILSQRNKRIIELYKRAERDAEMSPTRIKFTQKIQNPNKQKQLQMKLIEDQLHPLKKMEHLRSSQKKMIDILKQAKERRKKSQLPNMRPQRSKSNIIINSYSNQTDNPEKQKNTLECKKLSENEKADEEQGQKQKKRVRTMRKIKYEPRKDVIIIRKKFNWKNQPLSLANIQKQQFQRLIRHYLNIPDPTPIASGFYKAYIGPGNNNALIKKLLKDRGYWQIVDSLDDEPNFVWTQIRSAKFVGTLGGAGKREIRTIPRRYANLNLQSNPELTAFIKSKRNDYINTCQKLLEPKHFLSLMHQIKQRFTQGHNILYFLRLKQAYIDYLQDYTGKQLGQAGSALRSAEIRLHNHMENSGAIGDKKQLLYMMGLYCKIFGEDLNAYIPKTVHLQTPQQHNKIFQSIPNGPWILKPGEATNRGQGITVHTTRQSLISQLTTKKKKHRCGLKFTNIIQEYIDPLLYNGRKFDIRVWVLWTGRRLWWYREGYLRTSSREFTLKSLNKFVHLTNDAIQSQSEDFGKYEPANKLSFNQFEKYLEKERNYHGFYTEMLEQMKKLAIKAFRIGNQVFDPQNREHNFQLFGLDFLIDSTHKPWLIECNTNPCLQINCSLLARLVPNMLENVMNLTVDSYFPPPLKKKMKEGGSWGDGFRFQLIWDGGRDGEMEEKMGLGGFRVVYEEVQGEEEEFVGRNSIEFKQKQKEKQK